MYINGQYWVSTWNADTIHILNSSGAFVETIVIAGITGTRSMTTDGTMVYIGAAGLQIYVVDPVTKTLVNTINVTTGSDASARMCTYDETLDGGLGGFWIGNFGSDIAAVNMIGIELSVIPAAVHGTVIYGGAFDNLSPDGPHLWIHDQNGPDTVVQLNPATGIPTGTVYDFTADGTAAGATAVLAGGLFISSEVSPSVSAIVGLCQCDPSNLIFAVELTAGGGPNDNIDPIAVCQNITVQLNNQGTVQIAGINIDGGSTDNVGIVSYTAVPNTFNCNNLGANAVTLIVADAAGNTDSCIAIVTVEDNLDPNIIGQNATGNLNGAGSVTIPVSSVNNGSTDNCGIVNLTLTPNTFTTIGTYVGVLTGIDSSGNSDSTSVIITIIDTVDNIDPVAVCQNITVQLNNQGTVQIAGINIDGGSTDNIGIVSYTAVPDTFDCNDLGTNTVTLVVADAAGNTDTCTAIVSVEDNLDPNVVGQNTTGNLNGSGAVTIPVSSVNNGSTDNCSIVNLTLTPNTFTEIGTYTAILEGTDPSGNSDSVTVIITIIDTVDNEDPMAICQNITIQLDNSGSVQIAGINIDGGSTDNVGIVSYTAVPDTFDCNDLGTNTVTLVVADAAGNTDTCTAIVTVEDNHDPTIIGQDATGDLNGTGAVTIPVSSVNNGSTDNCEIINLTLTPNTFTQVGTYTAVLEGTDSSGNSDSITVIINIEDSTLSIIDQEITSFTVYPNPANTIITIKVDGTVSVKKVEIYDISGKLLINKKPSQSSQTLSINISELSHSIYFMTITDENENKVTKKIVKK
jgi:hypothetical protein